MDTILLEPTHSNELTMQGKMAIGIIPKDKEVRVSAGENSATYRVNDDNGLLNNEMYHVANKLNKYCAISDISTTPHSQ